MTTREDKQATEHHTEHHHVWQGQTCRLDQAVVHATGTVSRAQAQKLIAAGLVRLNHHKIETAATPVKPGDQLHMLVPIPAPVTPRPQPLALTIVYEDSDLIVIEKPPGLVVHPAPGNPDRTLVNALLAHCELSDIGDPLRPGIVHRLDKDTGGLMVAAKNNHAHTALAEQFAARTIERTYQVLVWGCPDPPQGEITAPIGRHERHRKKMAVRINAGKAALTRYETIARYPPAQQTVASLLSCRLGSGRTHQIRVHLSHIKCPVVGDPVYLQNIPPYIHRYTGKYTASFAPQKDPKVTSLVKTVNTMMGHQALHATSLGFIHPVSKKHLHFACDLPQDMETVITKLEGET